MIMGKFLDLSIIKTLKALNGNLNILRIYFVLPDVGFFISFKP